MKFPTKVLSLLCITTSLISCEGIYDYEGDCSKSYDVGIKFTRNILEANAFSNKVTSISVLVYNTAGELVYYDKEAGDPLKNDNYYMPIDVKPGTYDIVVWGGLENSNSFLLNNGYIPATLSEASCHLQREEIEGEHYSRSPLSPLFHGIARGVVIQDNEEIGHIRVADIDLTKDTNNIKVILTHNNEETINPDDYSFSVADANGRLNFDNSLLEDKEILYHAHTKYELPTVDIEEKATRSAVNVTNSMMAEIDMSRLMADRNPRLQIHRTDNDEPIVDLPLTQLLLHAKGEARSSMSNQEYLDRQDEFTLVFFLGDDNGWNMSAGIYINGWHMSFQYSDI
ncbi:MAG: FimB/Mfa2 family fimbrial subunit [Muribaculaceae bacterium]|nr:FimB/Mfa2 family fimbrial subunit [Muribaculaceae bacterium]